jgi:circadian clock protein KaiC
VSFVPPPSANNRGVLVSTGCAGLDDVLGGGLTRNHLYLIEGDPGTGKTTLALQFLLAGAAAGEKGIYITLSESPTELTEVARSHNWSLDGISLMEMAPHTSGSLAEEEYTVFHPSDVELGDTIKSVLDRVEELHPTRVVFDSLSELRMLARESLRYRRQILALKRYFSDKDTTVLLLDDRTAEGNDLQLQSIAHGVIMLQSVEREYGVKRRRLEVRKMRGSRFREGFHDYTIETGGVQVYPRLIAAEHRPPVELIPVRSGVKELDDLFAGGIDFGTSTLMMGPAGSGKSTVALQYAYAEAKRGEHAAVYTFDESLQTMFRRCETLGMDLAEQVRREKLSVEQVDPAELSPGEFVTRVRDSVARRHTRLLVIDSLNGFLNAMPGEDFLILQLHEMLSFLSQQGVATVMTMAQHGMFGHSMNSPVDVSYIADTVLLFRYYEAQGAIHKALSVVKKRSGGHESSIRELTFSPAGLKVGPPLADFHGVLTGVPILSGNGRSSESK